MSAKRIKLEINELKALLQSWKLEHLFSLLQGEKISIEVLKMMKSSHVSKLLCSYPLGEQVRFEYNFVRWRFQIGHPVIDAANSYDAATPAPKPQKQTIVKNETGNAMVVEVKPFDTNGVEKLLEEISTFCDLNVLRYNANNVACGLIETEPPNVDTVTLEHILKVNAHRAVPLLMYYKEHGLLQAVDRTELVNIVSEYFDKYDMAMPICVLQRLENSMRTLLPNEDLKNFYVISGTSKFQVRLRNMKYYRNLRKKRSVEQSQRMVKEE